MQGTQGMGFSRGTQGYFTGTQEALKSHSKGLPQGYSWRLKWYSRFLGVLTGTRYQREFRETCARERTRTHARRHAHAHTNSLFSPHAHLSTYNNLHLSTHRNVHKQPNRHMHACVWAVLLVALRGKAVRIAPPVTGGRTRVPSVGNPRGCRCDLEACDRQRAVGCARFAHDRDRRRRRHLRNRRRRQLEELQRRVGKHRWRCGLDWGVHQGTKGTARTCGDYTAT